MAGRPVYLLFFLMHSPRLELVTLSGYSITNNDKENMEIQLWQSKVPACGAVDCTSAIYIYIFYSNSLNEEYRTMHWVDIIGFETAVILRK